MDKKEKGHNLGIGVGKMVRPIRFFVLFEHTNSQKEK